MATRIPEGASIKVVVDAVDATLAAISSDGETAALAPTWQALRDQADAQAKARTDAERALTRARARLAVADAKWDATVAAFGRAVVDASGGRRDQPPYTRFFNKTTPSQAQKFGIQRELETGASWLVELARNANEPLAQTWSTKLKAANDELQMALAQRNDGLRALEPLQTAVLLLTDDVNRELVRLEGDLKKLFPASPDRVSAYLSATRANRPAAVEEPVAPVSATGAGATRQRWEGGSADVPLHTRSSQCGQARGMSSLDLADAEAELQDVSSRPRGKLRITAPVCSDSATWPPCGSISSRASPICRSISCWPIAS